MDYTYVASGGLRVIGGAGYTEVHFAHYAYAVGSVVFSRPKAEEGVYYKICVKKVLWPTDTLSFENPPIYVDTFNAWWNEEDLVEYDDAVDIVQSYNIAKAAALENAVADGLI